LSHCLLFAFQLKKKNAAEAAKEMICSTLSENAVSYSTYKKWFQQFREENFNLQNSKRLGQLKKSGRRGVGANFGWEFLSNSIGTCKWAWSDSKSFPIAYRSLEGFRRNPGGSRCRIIRPVQHSKKDSENHRRLRLGNSSSYGVYSRLGPFWLSSISIPTTSP